MKGLVILLGECFRVGIAESRITSNPNSFDDQKNACMSHINWIKHIENKHKIKCDIVIDTYKTFFMTYLYEWFDDLCIDYVFHDYALGWNNLFCHAVERWKSIFKDYEFVHFVRIDLVLKPFFFNMFKLDDRVRYPSICFVKENYYKTYDNHPRVSDMMLYVPRKFFRLLDPKNRKLLDHDGWSQCVQNNLSYSDIDVYLKTFHDSDSAKDWNPIYRIANRTQNKIWYSKNYIFDWTIYPKYEKNDFLYQTMT